MLSESLLRQRLRARGALFGTVAVPAETVSTNNDCKVFAAANPSEPVLVAADYQSGGRGRQGKTFVSPRGGLYLSVLLPTGRPPREVVGVTSCAAVAVARAIEETTGAEARIKWVNDLVAGGGKVCGILCENVGDGALSRYLIVGVGVNLASAPDIPGAAFPPVSLAALGYPAEPEALAAAVAGELLAVSRADFSFSAFADEYRARSMVLGERIVFRREGKDWEGVAEAVDDAGALLVRTEEGLCRLDSGEISVRPAPVPDKSL